MLVGIFLSDSALTIIIAALLVATAAVIFWLIRRSQARQLLQVSLITANQKFQEANEEMAALNEELQASNEEYQSMNEQLLALNAKLEEANKTIAAQKDELLSEYRAYLDIIFTNTLEEILLLDLDGKVLLFNNAFAKFIQDTTGKTPVIGAYLWDTTVRERAEIARTLFKNALAGRASVIDAFIETPDGEVIHQLHYQPVTIEGKVQFVTIISKDITDYKRNESMMRQSEANMRNLFDHTEKLSQVASHTTNAVMIMDAAGKIEWINRSFTSLTGYRPEDVYGSGIAILYGPESDQFMIKKIADHIKQQKDISAELIHYKKSGEKFWLKVSITPVFNGDGSLKNFISVQSDISELKDFENSITSIARELASLIENANVPIFGVDALGNINEWNQVCADITGYGKNEVMSASVLDKLFDANVRDLFNRMVTDVLNGNLVTTTELTVITRNKKRLNLLMSASPRRAVGNTITGVLFVAQNITELTEYRQNLERIVNERTRELNEALSKERELVDMKSRFVSIASHEFRTPLSTISVATGILLKHREKLTLDEVDSKLRNIEKQVEHMTYMLDDVLLVEKSNSGKLTVQRKSIEILPFFTSLATEVEKSTGGSHHIVVKNELLISSMMSDEKLLRSIGINLLTNGIKFSPGTHRVDLTLSSDAENFVVQVKDFGIGIPEQDVKNLFEPFFRGGNVSTIQGTGLGLSIIKKSLDLLHGTIKVSSKLGEGTEIVITIPLHNE